MKILKVSYLCAGFLAFGATVLMAGESATTNWPQWRGPSANGVALLGNPPIQWSETNHIKWKAKIPGSGTSTPIVWENQVLFLTAIPTGKKVTTEDIQLQSKSVEGKTNVAGANFGAEKPGELYQFAVVSLDRNTGKQLWQTVVRETVPHEGHHNDHGYASYSPITDGQNIYASFGSRGLYCLDMNGKVIWQTDLGRMQTRNSFGEGSSPALFQNTLVVLWDHEGPDFIAGFDKTTGKELWRQVRDEDTSWSTPLIIQRQQRTEVIVNASKKIRSYELSTGKLLWECAGMTANSIPSPVADEDTVYCVSGFRGNSAMAIRLGRSGDLTGTDAIAWKLDKNTPYVPSPLLFDNCLYFMANNKATLTCCDAKTGKILIDAKPIADIPGVYASPVGVADRVYLVGRNGRTAVLKKGAPLEILSVNDLKDEIDASPVVSGDDLFLRGHENVYCISEK